MTRTPGFTAEVKNNTGFIITEITFGISIGGGPAEMYRVDDFMYQEPGVIYAGLPPDPTTKMRIDSLKSKKFQFELDRPEIDKKKKVELVHRRRQRHCQYSFARAFKLKQHP